MVRSRGGPRPIRALVAAALVVGAATVGLGPAGSARAEGPPLPVLTPVEMRDLGNQVALPGTAPVTSPPAITGHPAADARIQAAAFARGYRLRSTPTVGLVRADGVLVQPDTAAAWRALQAEAAAHGHRIVIRSGYRSVADQRGIFLRKLGGAGAADIAAGRADARIEAALRLNSIPGTSKHHTGHTVDIAAGSGSIGGFAGTAAYRWLSADNFAAAKRHGFLPSYPAGAGLQGPDPEPWELVWVGVDTIRCAASYVTLATPAPEGHCPVGSLDVVVDDGAGTAVRGWALDRDVPGAIDVHLYADGAFAGVVRADGYRPDVAAVVGTSPDHGFSARLALGPGPHRVCAYGINDRPGAVNRLLGCQGATVEDAGPVGSLDVATREGDRVLVAGWAADPDQAGPVDVHVYVDGAGAAVLGAALARPDVAAATGLGADRGFLARIPVAPGGHQVCAYAIGDRPGTNALLGCRTTT